MGGGSGGGRLLGHASCYTVGRNSVYACTKKKIVLINTKNPPKKCSNISNKRLDQNTTHVCFKQFIISIAENYFISFTSCATLEKQKGKKVGLGALNISANQCPN